MANTNASAGSYARYSLLVLQIKNILYNAGGIMPETMERIDIGLKKNYIIVAGIHGLYNDGEIGAELQITIDWRQHKLSVETQGERINAPKNWVDGYAPQINEAINTFNSACKDYSLKKEWYVRYEPHLDVDTINSELGFYRLPKRRWKYKPAELEIGISPLDEIKLSVKIGIM